MSENAVNIICKIPSLIAMGINEGVGYDWR
jgi:hypothetical protein